MIPSRYTRTAVGGIWFCTECECLVNAIGWDLHEQRRHAPKETAAPVSADAAEADWKESTT